MLYSSRMTAGVWSCTESRRPVVFGHARVCNLDVHGIGVRKLVMYIY